VGARGSRGAVGAKSLVEIGRQFYERRWMWGTSGNLSMRLSSNPLSIAITPSSQNKGHLEASDLLTITDGKPAPRHPKGWVPSAETLIHQAIYRAAPGAGAVFHVHPVYSTLISSFYGHPRERRMLRVEWFEMMKGLGVGEEESAEVAILPNWQDVSLIARDVTAYLKNSAKTLPVVLIYNHGLTGWGTTPDQARNHLEILEYVCQYLYLKTLARHS
jgi:methylthioribulose-1-phosphate dehydratase